MEQSEVVFQKDQTKGWQKILPVVHTPVSITGPPSSKISILKSPVFRRELADRNREFYELNTLLWLQVAMTSNCNLLLSSRNSSSVYDRAKELWKNVDWKAWLEATKFNFLLQAGLRSELQQVAQDIIQPRTKSLKGWSSHNLSRYSLWVLPLCRWRSFYLILQVFFLVAACAPCLLLNFLFLHLQEECASLLSLVSPQVEDCY